MDKTAVSETADTVFESPGDHQLEGRSRRGSVAVLKTEGAVKRHGVRIYPPSAKFLSIADVPTISEGV